MPKSFAWSMSVLSIFEIQRVNGELFLKAIFLSYAALFGLVTY